MKPQFMSQAKFPRCTPRTFVHVEGDTYTPIVTYSLRPVYVVPRPGVESVPVTLRDVWLHNRSGR